MLQHRIALVVGWGMEREMEWVGVESKVEAPVVDHLRDLGTDGEEFEVVEIFPM